MKILIVINIINNNLRLTILTKFILDTFADK